MRFFFASLLILQYSLAWAGPRSLNSSQRPEALALKNVAADFPQKKKITLQEFIQKLENKTSESYLQKLKQQVKPHLNEAIEFETLGPARFVLRAEGQETLVDIVDLEEGEFKLNNRRVTVDFSNPPEEVLTQINSYLSPKTAGHPLQALFFPRAEAFEWLLAAVGVTVVGLGIYNYYNCTQYDKLANQCTVVLNNAAATQIDIINLYNKTRDLNSKWFTAFCKKKDFVKTCETALFQKMSSPSLRYDGPRIVTPSVQ